MSWLPPGSNCGQHGARRMKGNARAEPEKGFTMATVTVLKFPTVHELGLDRRGARGRIGPKSNNPPFSSRLHSTFATVTLAPILRAQERSPEWMNVGGPARARVSSAWRISYEQADWNHHRRFAGTTLGGNRGPCGPRGRWTRRGRTRRRRPTRWRRWRSARRGCPARWRDDGWRGVAVQR
jgi:hypothetical protein